MAPVVTAGAVVAILEDGTPAYFYRGAELHSGVPADEVARLIGLGLVEDGEAFVPVFPPAIVEVTPHVASTDRPRRVASKEDWVEYAVAQGADRLAAETSTKEELIALYGA